MEASDYIAMAAGIIAIASFFVAIQQTRLQRIHNKLTVKPILTLYRKEFTNQPVEITLHNRGLGPAIIYEFDVCVDGKKVVSDSENEILEALDRLEISKEDVRGHLLGPDEVVNTGQEIILLRFNKSPEDEKLYKELMQKIPRLMFRFKYRSAYDERFELFGNG